VPVGEDVPVDKFFDNRFGLVVGTRVIEVSHSIVITFVSKFADDCALVAGEFIETSSETYVDQAFFSKRPVSLA